MKYIIIFVCILINLGCSNNFKNENRIESPIKNPKDPTEKSITDHYEKLLEFHNKFRKQNGCAALELNNELNLYAQKHADYMAKNQNLIHSKISNLLSKYKLVAENIAYGQKNEYEVVNSWMHSSGHRSNILNKKYKRVGFGLSKSKNGSNYWCAVFTN